MNANVGMMCPVYAPITAYTKGTGVTYGAGGIIAEAVSASLNWERADGTFIGDNVELDSDNRIIGYTIDFEPTGISDAMRAALLGEVALQSNNAATGEYEIRETAAPDVGFGYVRWMRATGSSAVEDKYEAWWFYKLKFSLNSEETRTKEKNVEWRVPTLSGKGAGVVLTSGADASFAVHETFSTEAAAIAYIKTKAGISG